MSSVDRSFTPTVLASVSLLGFHIGMPGPPRVQRMEGTGPEEPKDIDQPKTNRILRLAKNQSLDCPLAG